VEGAEQNEAIIQDRIHSFAKPGGVGQKFKNTQEKMFKALNLPKGAKEELNYPPDVAEKVLNGLPLWDETVATQDVDEDAEIDDEQRAKDKANQLTDE